MKYTHLGSLSFILILLVAAMSCSGPSKENKNDSSVDFDDITVDGSDQIKDVMYDIPSPSEIPFLLESTGAEYNEALVNDVQKVDGYASRNDDAALNLGVYATDIGYLVSYDKVQEALSYMGASKKLADNLGVSGAFDVQLVKRFENNLSEKDSLTFLLNETINKTEHYLKGDNRNRLAAMIITGSFIEGLYISTQLIDSYPKDILPEDSRNLILTPLIRVVLEQEKALGDLISMLGAIDQSGAVSSIVESLTVLKEKYEILNIEEQIKNNRGDLLLSDKTLAEITKKVKEVRISITK